MTYTPLPYKEEFLLELFNNNYSQETVDNYKRDLDFFESFLVKEDIEFKDFGKLAISKYKGFLKKGEHLKALRKLLDYKLKVKEKKGFEELDLKSPDLTDIANETEVKASSKAAKINFKLDKGLSDRSTNRMLSCLRMYLKYLVEIDQIVPISADAIKMVKLERKESQVAELNDLINLIEAPEKLESNPLVRTRNRAILELMFSTGMRISEIVNLNREQLNLYNHDEDAEGKIYVKGKGKKSRFVYLTPRCKYWLDLYLQRRQDNYPAVFIPYRGGRAGTKDPNTVRLSTNYIQERIVFYRRELGIVVPTSAHSLRHGFATYLAEQGASPVAIQKLLGHESLQTTTRYVHASDKYAESAHREYHPLQENNS